MFNSISISLGEMILKGKNRGQFEQKLTNQLLKVTKKRGLGIYRDRGKIFIDTENDIEELIDDIKNIFGIVLISPSIKVDNNYEVIESKVIELVKEMKKTKKFETFKISTKRADKTFYLKSMDMNMMLGEAVLNNVDDIKVDVNKPDLLIYVNVRSYSYIYVDRIKGAGGLPMATNGEGLVLLSGGIDSPVAAYMMARRGVKLTCVTFHAYPFTSQRSNEKVRSLVERLSIYCGDIDLYFINLLNIYKEIKEKCPEDQSTIIARRFMMRIGEKIAESKSLDFLITGESLGQVASQTAKSLVAIDDSVQIPILRPLIGIDKTEIIEMANNIGTFETSILPHEDCCTIFSPKHPQTQPKKEKIRESELKLDIEELINDALNNMEIEKIK